MADLQAQIEYKKQIKDVEKRKIQVEDAKKDKEIRDYNPYGRGGAGAPIRDGKGDIVTNAKRYVRDKEAGLTDNFDESLQYQTHQHQQQQQQQYNSPMGDQQQRNNPPPRSDVFPAGRDSNFPPQPPLMAGIGADGEKTFLRGQVNLDDMPPWQRDDFLKKQKKQVEMQNALQAQMIERDAKKREELRIEKEEERREMDRVDKEQEHLKRKFEEDQKRRKPDGMDDIKSKAPMTKGEDLKKKQQLAEEAYVRAKAETEALKGKNRRGGRNGGSEENVGSEPQRRADSPPRRGDSPPIPTVASQRSMSPPLPSMKNGEAANIDVDPIKGAYKFNWENIDEFSVPSSGPPAAGRRKEPSNQPPSQPEAQVRLENMLTGAKRRARTPVAPAQSSYGDFNASNILPQATADSSMDTKAVLAQLNAIQRDLEVEKLKVQEELRKPLVPAPLILDQRISRDSPSRRAPSKKSEYEDLKSTSRKDMTLYSDDPPQQFSRAKQYSNSRPNTSDRPLNNDLLEEQKKILKSQEAELKKLRGMVGLDSSSSVSAAVAALGPRRPMSSAAYGGSSRPSSGSIGTRPMRPASGQLVADSKLMYMETGNEVMKELSEYQKVQNELLEFESKFQPGIRPPSAGRPLSARIRGNTEEMEMRNSQRLRELEGMITRRRSGDLSAEDLALNTESRNVEVGAGWNDS